MWGALVLYLFVSFMISVDGEPLAVALWEHGPQLVHLPGPVAYFAGLIGIYILSLFVAKFVSSLFLKDDPEWGSFVAKGHSFYLADWFLILILVVFLVDLIERKQPLVGILAVLVPTAWSTIIPWLARKRKPKAKVEAEGQAPTPKAAQSGALAQEMDFETLLQQAKKPSDVSAVTSRFEVVRVSELPGISAGSQSAEPFDVSWLVQDEDYTVSNKDWNVASIAALDDSRLIEMITANATSRPVQTAQQSITTSAETLSEGYLRVRAFVKRAIESTIPGPTLRPPSVCLAQRRGTEDERDLLLCSLIAATGRSVALWRVADTVGLALPESVRLPAEIKVSEFFDSSSGKTWNCVDLPSAEGVRIVVIPAPVDSSSKMTEGDLLDQELGFSGKTP